MNDKNKEISFSYNPMLGTLEYQARRRGFYFEQNTLLILEKIGNGIFELKFISDISEMDHKMLLEVFHKIVVKCLKKGKKNNE